MGALRLAFGLFFSFIGLFGYMAFDYTMTNRAITAGGAEPIGFFTYIKGWTGLAGLVAQAATEDGAAKSDAPLPEGLLNMMPKPPAGWTARIADEADGRPFLTEAMDDKTRALVLAALTPDPGRGVERVAQTYQNGPRSVVIELVRYPDMIFTSLMAMQVKMELQMATFQTPSTDFMTVRGLEIREARLPANTPARVFLADVGGQIHLRVLAPPAMTDQDLLPFFETLHVPAMNADVVEKVAGLGEVPVIVLASVISEETRKAREAEIANAKAAREADAEAERQKAEAEKAAAQEADPQSADPQAAPEQEGTAPKAEAEGGVKVNKGIGKDKSGTSNGGLGGNCRTENGRKVCGGLDN